MPVEAHSFVASGGDTRTVLAELDRQVSASGPTPDMVFVFYGPRHDDTAIAAFLAERLPGVPVVGGTTGRGLMSPAGLADEHSVGLLLLADPDGRFGAAGVPFEPGDVDPGDAAETALHRALAAADATGELPELIWLYQSPGHEEQVLSGLQRVVGDRCPIIGGSAADDDLTGQWRQLGPGGPMAAGVVVAALFPSGGVSFAYQGGFEPTGHSGVVTEVGGGTESGTAAGAGAEPVTEADETAHAGGADRKRVPGGHRHVLRIDDEPAAEVYDRWLGGVLPAAIVAHGGSILAEGNGYAVGVAAGSASGMTYFRLVQPGSISAQQGLVTFANVRRGTRLYGMRGSKEGLVRRASRVVTAALSGLGGAGEAAGGLVLYCAGCREAVGEDIDRVAATLCTAFGGCAFLGGFTDGEQGPLLETNVHANLMITAVVFGR